MKGKIRILPYQSEKSRIRIRINMMRIRNTDADPSDPPTEARKNNK
jgi:hypothetical protein